jgi:uncharacterized membrane protein YeaQ/YmgE (transglycosylase-associated protein family)
MLNLELAPAAQQWANDVLVWVGFGTLVGLLAKLLMPGRDPGGAIATLLMGIVGTIMGCGTLMFANGQRVSPISPMGFLAGTAGALVLLVFYRMLGGRYIADRIPPLHRRTPRHSRRAHTTVINAD